MINLTKREEEVASLIAKGLSNLEISNTLNITQPTVKLHVYRILRKFNSKNRVELAIKYLLDRGIITYTSADIPQDI